MSLKSKQGRSVELQLMKLQLRQLRDRMKALSAALPEKAVLDGLPEGWKASDLISAADGGLETAQGHLSQLELKHL